MKSACGQCGGFFDKCDLTSDCQVPARALCPPCHAVYRMNVDREQREHEAGECRGNLRKRTDDNLRGAFGPGSDAQAQSGCRL